MCRGQTRLAGRTALIQNPRLRQDPVPHVGTERGRRREIRFSAQDIRKLPLQADEVEQALVRCQLYEEIDIVLGRILPRATEPNTRSRATSCRAQILSSPARSILMAPIRTPAVEHEEPYWRQRADNQLMAPLKQPGLR